MTASLSRRLFRQILLLYPEPFRREFADEMLGVFDQCRLAQPPSRLLIDGLMGALKQQSHYRALPALNRTGLYAEVPAAPTLARSLGIAALAFSFLATALVQEQNPQAARHWIASPVVHEILYMQRATPSISAHSAHLIPRSGE